MIAVMLPATNAIIEKSGCHPATFPGNTPTPTTPTPNSPIAIASPRRW